MIRRIFFVFLLLSSYYVGWGQVTIHGTVLDRHTRSPLSQVHVVNLSQPGQTMITDSTGQFHFHNVKVGDTLRLTHVGYQPVQIPVVLRDTQLRVEMEAQPYQFRTVKVIGHQQNQNLHQSAGAIAKLNEEDLTKYNNTSVKSALNTVPGVKMESRGQGGSRRISIRGSMLRSPWGVRNIKAYWNGIPITNPEGSTPLEVIDASTLASAEVIRGPVGSIYGAGNGGILLFQSEMPAYDEKSVSSSVMTGAYSPYRQIDYYRTTHELKHSTRKADLYASYVRQDDKGYRAQEFVEKALVQWRAALNLSPEHRLSVLGYHYDGGWGLPGALDVTDYKENPRQADPFSVTHNAAVYRDRTRLGISHQYTPTSDFTTQTVLYGKFTTKENPYGTSPYFNGYKIGSAAEGGGRFQMALNRTIGRIDTRFLWGAEGQFQRKQLREYNNDFGEPGQLRQQGVTDAQQYLVFGQMEMKFPWDIHLTGALSFNQRIYQHWDQFHQDTVDYSARIAFKPELSPRIALVKSVQDWLAVHSSISMGFSPPTFWEVANPDGSLNESLQPETGTNYEAGVRLKLLDNRWKMNLTSYYFRLHQAIVPRETREGYRIFTNAGETEQKGIELQTAVLAVDRSNGWLQTLKPWGSYTHQAYFFRDYIVDGQNMAGNRVTGVPAHMANVGLVLRMKYSLQLHITHRIVGATPLTDENSIYLPAYQVTDARLGYQLTIFDQWQVDVAGGVDNLFNTLYSSFPQLNGFSGKYYNPAPGRNFYLTVQLQYDWE